MSVIHLRLLGSIELSACESGSERRLGLAPKPLALLAYLAVASAAGRPVRRDVLLALFWPELSGTRARAALRQVLFQLRRALNESALIADRETIALVPDVLACDAVASAIQPDFGSSISRRITTARGPLFDSRRPGTTRPRMRARGCVVGDQSPKTAPISRRAPALRARHSRS